jgi:O-antigen/teichoic acid export membrane protein
MSDLSKQAGILSLSEFVRFFFKTLIGIALARILTQGDYGSYRQLFLIYATFSTLLLLGIPQSVLYFLPRANTEAEQKLIITRTLNLITMLAFVFSSALVIFRAQIAVLFNNPELETLLVIYGVYPLFVFVTQLFSSIMLGMKRTDRVAKFTLFCICCDVVIVLGAALIFRSLLYIVSGVMISALLQWFYAQFQLRRYTEVFHFDREGLRAQLRYSIPLGLSSIIGMLSVQLDKIVISGYFNPEQFAVFSIGAMELPFIGIMTNSVNSVLLPALSSKQSLADSVALYRATIRKNALIIFPIAIYCFVFAGDILTFLYSNLYSGSTPYFRIYLFTIILRVASYGILFQAFNKTKVILYISVLTLITNLGLNLFLVRQLGMMGPAIATVAVSYLGVVIYLILIPSMIKIHLRELFPLLALAKTMAASLASGLIVYYASSILVGTVFRLGVGFAIFGASYYLSGRLFGALLPYDLNLAQTFILGLLRKARLLR